MEEREIFVKTKIINGKKLKGAIDAHLNVVVPFEYAEISRIRPYLNLFICRKEDGRCSFYNDDKCIISYRRGYTDLECIHIDEWHNIKFIAEKGELVGIIKGKFDSTKFTIDYEFGKADEIINMQPLVKLIKHSPDGDLIGYYSHICLPNKIIEPEYAEFKTGGINCEEVTFRGDTYNRTHNHRDGYPDHWVQLSLGTIEYAKYDQGKLVYGLKYVNNHKERYIEEEPYKDFLLPIYSKIKYDPKQQMFLLEQKINGEVKKGFKAVAFDWKTNIPESCLWLYFDLLEIIDVPCEYDDITFVEPCHAILKKGDKYGVIKYSYNFSQFENRHAYGKKYEISPIIYDSIEPIKTLAENKYNFLPPYIGYFIGRIGDEVRLITDCFEKEEYYEDNKPITIANDYKSISQILDHAFVCELANGKKELILINEQGEKYTTNFKYIEEFRTTCDDAKAFDDCFIKIINEGITDLYHFNYHDNSFWPKNIRGSSLSLIAKNIIDIRLEKEVYLNNHRDDKYYVTKANGHIEVFDRYGNSLLSTESLNVTPDNIRVSYDNELDLFKIENNSITKYYLNRDIDYIFKDREFTSIDTLKKGEYFFAGYTEKTKEGNVTKLVTIDPIKVTETELLNGNYNVENIVYKGERIIYSGIDPKTGKKKYGVIESSFGKQCIPFEYDYIEYTTDIPYSDRLNQLEGAFICKSKNESIVYDQDGFYYDKLNAEYDYNKSPITTLTLNNNPNNNPQKNQS